MANLKKKLKSGADIEIQVATFEKSHALMQASRLGAIPSDNIVDLILTPPVQEALWPCMAVCLYNGQKINRDTFESENSRPDYLIVAKEVFMVNVRPFFQSLASESRTESVDQTSEGQK